MSNIPHLQHSVRYRGIQWIALGALMFIAFGSGATVGYAQQVKLARHVVSAAAVRSDGIKASIGQPTTGRTQSVQTGGIFGFWATAGMATTSVDATPLRPTGLDVETYPNPFREQTAFRVDLPSDSDLRVDIIDAAGRTVSSFTRMDMQRGNHSITWSARDNRGGALPSGAYRAILTTADASGADSHRASVLLLHTR